MVCQKLSNNWLNQFAKKSKSNLTRRHTCLPQQSLKLRKISNRVSTSYINTKNLCDGFDPDTRLKKIKQKLLLSFNFRHILVVSCILHIFNKYIYLFNQGVGRENTKLRHHHAELTLPLQEGRIHDSCIFDTVSYILCMYRAYRANQTLSYQNFLCNLD